MPTFALEWLQLALRWIHVIAGIMWIGDSFLFMWMDRNLAPPSRPRDGAVAGELWMVHSGGFYEVVKRKYLAPTEVPPRLHWFMWEAYTTWISGFFLLGIVYYFGGAVFLVDRSVSHIGVGAAIGLSLGLLVAGYLVYEMLWSSPLAKRPTIAAVVSFMLIVATAWGLTRVFSGRAAFIHVGAMLGTIMAANVAHHIIPAQRKMLAATRAGEPVDVTLGEKAKSRSTHNHYLTLPVLVTMLSSHFPSSYGHPLAWLVLTLLMVVGAASKYVMNYRRGGSRWVLAAGVAALAGAITLTARVPGGASAGPDLRGAPAVPFVEAQAIVERRCVSCHATRPAHPSFPEPPGGVALDDPEHIRSFAPRIMERAVATRTMPLGNLTGMTDEERLALGAWITQGARIDSAGSTDR
ncbi:MAG: urate hydroxylase PuuD [Candidatus Eiseniibacteriota bacterium]